MIKIVRQSLDNGYPTIKVYGDPLVEEGMRVYEHRYVLMKKLGRKLRKNEEGHHKDHNPFNNKPSNIQLKKKGVHQSDHSKEWWAMASPEQRLVRGKAISAAKKGKPQPWATGEKLRGIQRPPEFKQKVSQGMKSYVAGLPAGEMARRAALKKKIK